MAEFAVAGVLLIQDSEYLLQLRDNNPNTVEPGKVTVWGGSIEDEDDSPKAAAKRELEEETGVVVSADELKPLLEFTTDGKGKLSLGKPVGVYIFYVKIASDIKVNCYEGESVYRARSVEDIPEDKRIEILTRSLEAYESLR